MYFIFGSIVEICSLIEKINVNIYIDTFVIILFSRIF